MPPVVNPVSDLARIYRQRVPTQAGQPAARSDRFGFGMATRPTGQTSSNPLGAVGRFMKTAVASLDPRFILSEGGRSVEHVVGDVTELGRSVVSGKDTLSQSPSARAYQAAGGGAPGVFAAAMPYVNVATALIPEARLLTPAGRVAAGADAFERGMGNAILRSADERIAQRPVTAMPQPRPSTIRTTLDELPNAVAQPVQTVRDLSPDEVRDLFRDFNPSVRTQLDELPSSPSTSQTLPRGVYAMDDAQGNVTLMQLDEQNKVIGELKLDRTPNGYYVSTLSAQPGGTTTANLLAGAKITAGLNFPDVEFPLMPSENLSIYSRPLVEKLQAAGLISPNYNLPPTNELNNIVFPFHNEYAVQPQIAPMLKGIDPLEVRSASRDLIRALAQAKREGRLSPDTITRSAELRNELARRQALVGLTPENQMIYDAMRIGNEEFAVPRGFQLPPLYRDILAKQDQFYLPGIMDELGEQYLNARWNNPYEAQVA